MQGRSDQATRSRSWLGRTADRLARIRGYARPGRALLLLRDSEAREAFRLTWSSANLFQPHGDTIADRYPVIFARAKRTLADRPGLSLLSFGCSVGDEVLTLARLFPAARITGVDISAARIAECRRRIAAIGEEDRIDFAVAGSAEDFQPACFDAVFAMSVFRHGDLNAAPPRCDHRLDFADFERAVTDLARCVKTGGLLLLRHANFRFADTEAARDFDVLDTRPRGVDSPLYDRTNCLFPPELQEKEAVIFRRHA
ncbi:MAG: hypothetical protein JWN66_347 [Sphingomonas bacterium]|uniref:SAM-dependent methyltransferase n=1 Tax=Sphingomonas bacterium TaxID=1895847 RepID=UPI00260F296B|nr:class I SAM-dependent methyltransferase [Sphingomonas bacterium]MDB5703231.1 hypothetical protein [Sphingomonas bacterium]